MACSLPARRLALSWCCNCNTTKRRTTVVWHTAPFGGLVSTSILIDKVSEGIGDKPSSCNRPGKQKKRCWQYSFRLFLLQFGSFLPLGQLEQPWGNQGTHNLFPVLQGQNQGLLNNVHGHTGNAERCHHGRQEESLRHISATHPGCALEGILWRYFSRPEQTSFV